MPKNVLIDIGFAALAALSMYRIARMIMRDEALVRDGWLKWKWEPAELNRWMFVVGMIIHAAMIAMAAFFIYADFKGWTR